eukprot:Stramenopile-MAST_4_protein_1913
MGCSIQPDPGKKNGAKVEAKVGHGLHQRHAYSIVGVYEIEYSEVEVEKWYQEAQEYMKNEDPKVDEESAKTRFFLNMKENDIDPAQELDYESCWKSNEIFEKYKKGGGEKILRFVACRNPWGRGEWTGPFGDESLPLFFRYRLNKAREDYWDALNDRIPGTGNETEDEIENKAANVNVSFGNDDGIFHMEYEDWKANMTIMFRCLNFTSDPQIKGMRIKGKWTQDVAGGGVHLTTWYINPKLNLEVEDGESCNFFMSLSQEDHRLKHGVNHNKNSHPIGFHIVRREEEESLKVNLPPPYAPFSKNPSKKINFMKMMIEGEPTRETDDQAMYKFNHATSCWCTLGPGKYYIIPSIYKNKQIGSFYFSIYGDGKWTLEDGEKILGGKTSEEKKIVHDPEMQQKLKKDLLFEEVREKFITVAEKRGIHISTLLSMFDSTGKDGDGSDEKSQKNDKPVLLTPTAFKSRLLELGFMNSDITTEGPNNDFHLLAGEDDLLSEEEFYNIFQQELEDKAMYAKEKTPPPEDDLLFVPPPTEIAGNLYINVVEGRDLQLPAGWFNKGSASSGLPLKRKCKLLDIQLAICSPSINAWQSLMVTRYCIEVCTPSWLLTTGQRTGRSRWTTGQKSDDFCFSKEPGNVIEGVWRSVDDEVNWQAFVYGTTATEPANTSLPQELVPQMPTLKGEHGDMKEEGFINAINSERWEWLKQNVLHLGKQITPRLSLSAYTAPLVTTKGSGGDQLIGKCDIPISLISSLGFDVGNKWFPLYRNVDEAEKQLRIAIKAAALATNNEKRPSQKGSMIEHRKLPSSIPDKVNDKLVAETKLKLRDAEEKNKALEVAHAELERNLQLALKEKSKLAHTLATKSSSEGESSKLISQEFEQQRLKLEEAERKNEELARKHDELEKRLHSTTMKTSDDQEINGGNANKTLSEHQTRLKMAEESNVELIKKQANLEKKLAFAEKAKEQAELLAAESLKSTTGIPKRPSTASYSGGRLSKKLTDRQMEQKRKDFEKKMRSMMDSDEEWNQYLGEVNRALRLIGKQLIVRNPANKERPLQNMQRFFEMNAGDDNCLDYNEFRNCLKDFNVSLEEKQLKMIMLHFDYDQDKSLCIDEIMFALRKALSMRSAAWEEKEKSQDDDDDGLGALPGHVTKHLAANGRWYFRNHLTKTTSWQDPRVMGSTEVLDKPAAGSGINAVKGKKGASNTIL